MSLEEEPVIVSVVAIEETSFVIDVVTPPLVPAIDVIVDPATTIIVDIASSGVDVTGVEVTSFVVDVVTPSLLAAVDVTIGDPAATIIVDIPGESGGGGSGLPTTGGAMTGAIQLPPESHGFNRNNTAIHFGDPSSGMYGSGGVPTFSVNGIQVLILNEDLVITPSIRQWSDGSASNPAYAFDSGIAGMYKSGDELAFASGGGVILPADPTADLHAATKQYVDARTPLITVAPSAPSSPATGDIWIDTEGVGGGGGVTEASSETAARVMANGLVIPYYLYPDNPYTDANVQLLLDLMRTYHDVPVLVVVNPADGPGTVMDGNWSAFIRMVQAAGGRVCGYVSTVYATRAEADVKADIDLWLSVYSTSRIDGIFLDEQTWETGPGNVGSDYVDLYKRYTDYCHDAGLSPVIANPGTNQQGAYFATWTADIILVHEQTTWPAEATMEGNFVGGHADYSYTRRGALVYNQSTLSTTELATLRKNVQWVYVTDDNLTAGILNPWDSLPTYLDELFAALSG